jgi:hypothetical protein
MCVIVRAQDRFCGQVAPIKGGACCQCVGAFIRLRRSLNAHAQSLMVMAISILYIKEQRETLDANEARTHSSGVCSPPELLCARVALFSYIIIIRRMRTRASVCPLWVFTWVCVCVREMMRLSTHLHFK